MTATDYCVVFVTCPADRAADLARAVVEASLAACVNIVPAIRSIYRWEGKVCDEAETLLMMKSRLSRFDQLKQHIQATHPYDVPEIIALPITAGYEPYLQWIDRNIRNSD